VPEGDTLHRAAARLQCLVGERLEVEALHPRARASGVAEQLDGRRLSAVEAGGKNLLLMFEGGLTLRSHLRMSGRWSVQPRGFPLRGRAWLVLRGVEAEALLFGGPVLELHRRALGALGPDILGSPPEIDAMLRRLRSAEQQRTLGETLQDQRLVAGIGNMWMSETLWRMRLSPWLPLGALAEEQRRAVLETAAAAMRAAVEGRRERKQVHGRAGRLCRRCGGLIRSRGQGEANRSAYWCPACQPDEPPALSAARVGATSSSSAGSSPRIARASSSP
jgi:endonuclease-8